MNFKHLKQWNNLEVKKEKTKDKDAENIPHLEITRVILVHYNLGNNTYQQGLSSKFIYLKTFNSADSSYTEVWFTDQNSKPLEIKDKFNLSIYILYIYIYYI